MPSLDGQEYEMLSRYPECFCGIDSFEKYVRKCSQFTCNLTSNVFMFEKTTQIVSHFKTILNVNPVALEQKYTTTRWRGGGSVRQKSDVTSNIKLRAAQILNSIDAS